MNKHAILRVVTLVLAWIHTFPAAKHLALFFTSPSCSEAWKGFGGAFAVGLYLLPVAWQARGLAHLWSRHRALLVVAGWLLAAGHAVPAIDHLPKWLAHPSWAEAWRGFGSAIAAVWFASPLPVQGRFVRFLRTTSERATLRAHALFAS